MASAKDIVIKPIISKAANVLVKRVHYSGKVVNNSVLHLGAFLNDKLEGAMSFGSPMDKRKVLPLVEGTQWNGMLELNRMAFSDLLPRNSESRALAVAFRLIKKHYPHIEWILSFSDATQCGDGAIYRASGFVLTQIKKNSTLIKLEDGTIAANITYSKAKHILKTGLAKMSVGAEKLEGFQLRYIYFLNPEEKTRLVMPILPFSKIDKIGAGMYKGKPKRVTKANSGDQLESGGAIPTRTLQSQEVDA